MTPFRLIVLFGVWCAAFASAAPQDSYVSADFAEDSDYLASDALHEVGLRKFWQLSVPLDAGQEITDAYLVDDQVYLVTNDGYAFAIHADTGVLRWVKRVTRGGYRLSRPAHSGDRVLFVTPALVSQYDRVYGTPIEQIDLRFPAGSPAETAGRVMFLGGIDRRAYAFNLENGYELWKFRTEGQIVAQPTFYEGALYVASDDGAVYSCNAQNRAYRWIYRSAGSLKARPVVDANGVYAASTDHSLYLIERNTGALRWQARLSGPLTEPPVVTPEVVFQYSREDGLVAINTHGFGDEERIRWNLREGRALLTLDEKRAFVLGAGRLIVADQKTGDVESEIAAPNFTIGMPAPFDGAVLLASRDGRVFCARSRDVPFPRADAVRAALFTPRPAAEAAAAKPEEAVEGPARPADPLAQPTNLPVSGKSKVTRGFGGTP